MDRSTRIREIISRAQTPNHSAKVVQLHPIKPQPSPWWPFLIPYTVAAAAIIFMAVTQLPVPSRPIATADFNCTTSSYEAVAPKTTIYKFSNYVGDPVGYLFGETPPCRDVYGEFDFSKVL